jgi:hypothetical protein
MFVRMAGVDDDRAAEIEVRGVTGGPPPRDHVPDVIEVGSTLAASQRRRLGVVGLVCVALVVGVIVGYLVGARPAQRKTSATVPTEEAPTPLSLVSAGAQPPTATRKRCAVQLGNQLQLGVELVNQSSLGTTLMRADVNLPLGGLRMTESAWSSCGQLAAVDDTDPHALPSGATAWLRMTFDVLTPCPGPLPVLFTVTYAQAGKVAAANVGGFSDLGDVSYTGCSASPG